MANNTAVVKVLADNADLTKKLAQAERKLKGFERAAQRSKKNTRNTFAPLAQSAQNVGGPLGKAVGGLGLAQGALSAMKNPAAIAAAGFAAVALAAKGLEDSLNVTRDLAKQTNKLMRETGLSAEAASAYIGIADRFGISTAKLSTQFGFLSKKLRAANGDTKAASTALAVFADAGVSEAAVRSGDLNRVLTEAADRFAAMKDGPEKTALAMQLFGRSGKDLLPVLNQGGSGIEELRAKMEALGLTISGKTVKQNKELGKATKDLNQVMRGLMNTIGVSVLPKVTRLTQAFSEAIVKFRMGKKPTTDFQRVIFNLGKTFGWLRRHTSQLKQAVVNAFNMAFPHVASVVRVASRLIRTDWGGVVRSIRNSFAFFKSIPGRVGGWISRLPGRLRGLAGRMAAAGRHLGQSFINAIGRGLSRTGNFLGDIGGSIKRWINNNTLFGDTVKVGPLKLKLPALAQGGIVTGPTIALVGEAGPEAVVPLSGRNGRRARAAGFGGGQTVQNFTIHTTGSVDEQALAAKIGWTLATRGLA